jgi:hypothetical protein
VITGGKLLASFRDPSGFVFRHDGALYRQINMVYQDNYDCLISSGLYRRLVEAGLLIPHTEAGLELAQSDDTYKVIHPQVVEFVSYSIEFVPKEDPKVQRLLATRDDIFPKYTQQGFEAAFSHYFAIQRTEHIKDSLRILYLMEAKRNAH